MKKPPKDSITDLVRAKPPYCASGIANVLFSCLTVELSYKALWRGWLPFLVGEKEAAISILSTLQRLLLFHYYLYSERREWNTALSFDLPIEVAEKLVPVCM